MISSPSLAGLAAARGLSLRALAAELGCTHTCVQRWDRRQRAVPRALAAELSALLGVSSAELGQAVRFRVGRWHIPSRLEPAPRGDGRTAVLVGTCAEGDRCARWRCRVCGQYWLGSSLDHRCQAARTTA